MFSDVLIYKKTQMAYMVHKEPKLPSQKPRKIPLPNSITTTHIKYYLSVNSVADVSPLSNPSLGIINILS